jgi:hypothetical protein
VLQGILGKRLTKDGMVLMSLLYRSKRLLLGCVLNGTACINNTRDVMEST